MERKGVRVDGVAMHVGVGWVGNISGCRVAGVLVFNITAFMALVDLLKGELFNDGADTLRYELPFADVYGEWYLGLLGNKFVDGDLLDDFLSGNSGFHFGDLNVVENVLIAVELNLFLVGNGDGGPDDHGVRYFLGHGLHGIGNLGRCASALGGAASAASLASA